MTIFGDIEERLISWAPKARRRAALHVLVWSVVLMAVNVGLYVAGVMGESHLILVTLILSWLALTLTSADLVATTDVREEEDESSSDGPADGDTAADEGGNTTENDGNDAKDAHGDSDNDDAVATADTAGGHVPTLATLDAVVAIVDDVPSPVYARFSPGPEHDQRHPSVDYASGLELPGLSVNPLNPPPWWRDRPLREWVARQLCSYQHLQEEGDRRCWLLTGTVTDRGPDNEPLLVDITTLAQIAVDVVEQCEQLKQSSSRAEDRAERDGSAPWHAAP